AGSSVGHPRDGIGRTGYLRRLQSRRKEARVRRWCPPAGRGGPRRISRPPGVFSGSAKAVTPRALEGTTSPKGISDSCMAARARGGAAGLSDATSVEGLEQRVAARKAE